MAPGVPPASSAAGSAASAQPLPPYGPLPVLHPRARRSASPLLAKGQGEAIIEQGTPTLGAEGAAVPHAPCGPLSAQDARSPNSNCLSLWQ